MHLTPDGRTLDKAPTMPWPIFRLAFRPFFWFGTLFSILSIATWALLYTGTISFSPYGGGLFWHAHEMLFGFAAAIISGFLLTAVKNWTAVPTPSGLPLALLFGLWLCGRLLIAFPLFFPVQLIIAVDVLFLPTVAFCFAIPIFKSKNWRNLFFIVILLGMASLNTVFHLSALGYLAVSFVQISHIMIMMVVLVMTIMGGRVFPMFTANGTRTPRVASIPWLEKASISSVILSIIVTTHLLPLNDVVTALVYFLAGALNFYRAVRWRIWVTFSAPLVWSLHLSYWAVCFGLILLGFNKLGILGNASLAYHSITVGGMGMMILSMISRVSLGHTGHVIIVGKSMLLALLLLLSSFFARSILPMVYNDFQSVVIISAAFWVIGYGICLVFCLPILFKPRKDNGPG